MLQSHPGFSSGLVNPARCTVDGLLHASSKPSVFSVQIVPFIVFKGVNERKGGRVRVEGEFIIGRVIQKKNTQGDLFLSTLFQTDTDDLYRSVAYPERTPARALIKLWSLTSEVSKDAR